MSRTILCALMLTTGLILAPLRLSGQRSAQLLADARDQIRARKLDSAITLLHAITTSQADSSERAEAFMWLGVATFYLGEDSAVADAFRGALANSLLLMPAALLAKLDSGLAARWEHEQTIALCAESLAAWVWSLESKQKLALNSDGRAAQGPKIVSGPPPRYPDNLRWAEIQGRVWARAVIDTLGRAERASVRILSTTHPDFNRSVIEYTEHAHFSVAISSAGRVRSCVIFPVDFRLKH